MFRDLTKLKCCISSEISVLTIQIFQRIPTFSENPHFNLMKIKKSVQVLNTLKGFLPNMVVYVVSFNINKHI